MWFGASIIWFTCGDATDKANYILTMEQEKVDYDDSLYNQ